MAPKDSLHAKESGNVPVGDMNGHTNKGFRVIVVGAGVAGLTLSHTLQKAKIDHVVLERGPEAASPSGASIAMYPQGCRILEQIGCLKAAAATTAPFDRFVSRGPDGKVLMENPYWQNVRENHGFDILLMERREFLQTLYEGLPDQSRILFNKKVSTIKEDAGGVDVTLADGTVERGDIIIGADGVHSTVREHMWDAAASLAPNLITADEKKSLKTTWICLLGMGPGEPSLGNELSCVHNESYSLLLASQPNRTFYFVFFKVEKPYSLYTRPRWTDADAEEYARRVADHNVTEGMVFGDLWKKRYRAQVVDIEEGVLKHWHFGRTALVGDAVHKVTPNIALGGNSAMEDVVLLTNLLRDSIESHPLGRPNKATLGAAFNKYQETRIPRMKEVMDFSGLITRAQAWDGWLMKAVALYVLPNQPEKQLAKDIGKIIKQAPKLDFVPIKPYLDKRIAWDDEGTDTKGPETNVTNWQQAYFWGGCVALSSAVVWMSTRSSSLVMF